jgi:hypothetical protein
MQAVKKLIEANNQMRTLKEQGVVPFKWVNSVKTDIDSWILKLSRDEIMTDMVRVLRQKFVDNNRQMAFENALVSIHVCGDRPLYKSFSTVLEIAQQMSAEIPFGQGLYLEDADTRQPMEIPNWVTTQEEVSCYILLELLSTSDTKMYMAKYGPVAEKAMESLKETMKGVSYTPPARPYKNTIAGVPAWPFPTAESMKASA